jgi:hypothetical protein
MVHFGAKFFYNAMPSSQECMKTIRRNKLESVFCNVDTAFKIYLSLPVTDCSTERAFSKMARVKNDLHASMLNLCLNKLCSMTIKVAVLR